MYRLGNLGICNKIDWLVKNGKLQKKKIVIIPYNKDGIETKEYLRLQYGFDEFYLLDDEICKYNKDVNSIDSLKNIDDKKKLVFLINDMQQGVISNRLYSEYEIKREQMYVLKGDPLRSQDALLRCCTDSSIKTVLDVGGGVGSHANIFAEYGKKVTLLEAGYTCRVEQNEKYTVIIEDFIDYKIEQKFDLVWTSHVLEHQLNVEDFIKKLFDCCSDNGKVAITVPDEVTGKVTEGHVHFWNAGLLMYNIIKCKICVK